MALPLDCRKILAFSAVMEIATGGVLIADPALVVSLLLGADVTGIGIALGRCFGIALLALGLACWPGRRQVESSSPAVRAMLAYNALIALYLVYLFAVRHLSGVLLWPGVALHAGVALLLALTLRGERQATAIER
jgi:Ca2+/Na+ antiporter